VSRADLLANVERPPTERPAPSTDDGSMAGYWHGSATGEVLAWKRRALAAERELEAVRRRAAAWRPAT